MRDRYRPHGRTLVDSQGSRVAIFDSAASCIMAFWLIARGQLDPEHIIWNR